MTILRKEMRQSIISLTIWTSSIAFMIIICVIMYPQMQSQMTGINDMFSNMGAFSAAFGMDKINFGDLMGFYGIECGNILGIGGGFFAAYIGITILSKEEKEHTAEFLLTHPVSRSSVVLQKLASVIIQVTILNVVSAALAYISMLAIGESPDNKSFLLLHLAYFLLQLQIAGISFGISAFLRRSGVGIGLGMAAILYFANIIRNISDQAGFLKYVTPFAYAESADIISSSSIDGGLVLIGMLYALAGIAAALIYYRRKDIL